MRIVITGISAACALGRNREEIWERMKRMDSGISREHGMEDAFFKEFPLGALREYRQDWRNGDVRSLLFEVMDECLQDAGMEGKEGDSMAVSLGTSLLGTCEYLEFLASGESAFERCFAKVDTIREIYKRYHARKGVYTANIACASGTACFETALDLLRTDTAQYVLCGGFDYLGKLSICGFHSLNSLGRELCSPFDEERKGINLGEGCACFLLEEYEHARERGARIYAEVMECMTANEAYHITSSEPEGEEIIHLIDRISDCAGVPCEEIDYINLHGTGTRSNDALEQKVLEKRFPEQTKASSTKSLTGHCLGAAGAIEAYLTLLMMIHGELMETYHSGEALLGEHRVTERQQRIKYALSMSYAFSGNIAGVLFHNIQSE